MEDAIKHDGRCGSEAQYEGSDTARGVKDSDNPIRPPDLVAIRERAPAKGAKDSDIPTQFSGSVRGGGNQDALGSGIGEREQAPAKGVEDSGAPSAFLGEDSTDAAATLAGTRERAPVAGVMASDIPTQSIAKKSRPGGLRLPFATDEEVAKEDAQWSQPDMEEKMLTQTWTAPGAPFEADGGGPVSSARVAAECNRIAGEELTGGEGRTFAKMAYLAKVRELDALAHFRVFRQRNRAPSPSRYADLVGTRRALS